MPNTDKTILLPQLQRYDKKIKRWADNKFLTKADTPSLPKATATTLGGVKVGNGLSVTDDGTLSASGTGGLTTVQVTASANSVTQEQYDTIAALWPNTMFKIGEIIYLPHSRTTNDFYFSKITSWNDSTSKLSIPRYNRITIHSDLSLVKEESNLKIADPRYYLGYGIMAADATTLQCSSMGKISVKDGGITTAKIADGAITKAKLASDVEAKATESTLGEVYASVNSSMPNFVPLGSVSSQKGQGLVISNINDGTIATRNLADGAATTAKIADGAITASKLASGIEGWNGEVTTVTKGSGSTDVGIESSIRFITGDFYCYIINYYIKSTSNGSLTRWQMKDADGNDILLKTMGTSYMFQNFTPMSSKTGTWDYRTIMGFVARSTSAQAALATLLPVQDECEEMEAEVTKLEQDWIDNPDETVAVDGNGVPVTIAAKKTELEAKKAELEKLRQDYYSKLGDWRNEVQE